MTFTLGTVGAVLAILALVGAFILALVGQLPWTVAGLLMLLGASRLC